MTYEPYDDPDEEKPRIVPRLAALAATVILLALWIDGSSIVPTFGDVIAGLVWIGLGVALWIFVDDEVRARRADHELELRLEQDDDVPGFRLIRRPPYDQDLEE